VNVTLVFIILNYIGIFVFALSGGILSARKHLDPFGAAVIGAVTGMGGGTLRDVLLGRLPVYWIDAPHYLILALAGGVIGYYGSELVRGEEGARYRALIWADSARPCRVLRAGRAGGFDGWGALVDCAGHRRHERRLRRAGARYHRQ
jgi:hypothetical protein